MGKIKRSRQKYHSLVNKEKQSCNVQPMQVEQVSFSKVQNKSPKIANEMFSGIDISPELLLQQRLPDFDNCIVASNSETLQQHLSKKEKKRLRHERFLNKIESIKLARKKRKAADERRNKSLVGDMKTLEDALPTLDQLLRESADKQKIKDDCKSKFRSVKKTKIRHKEFLSGVQLFQQVWSHPAFKSDPDGTISEHLQNKLAMES